MTAALTRQKTQRTPHWSTILGILLVPLTVAGVLLWGLWNPTERLHNVTAAVVNLDEAVELDGQTVPLGRVLAGELIGDPAGADGGESGASGSGERQNFTWVLTDADDAQAGIDDGRYATVVTIPKTFSADATSLSGDASEARQARIDVTESDRGRLVDTALSSIVTQTATRVMNEQLGEQFVDGVYVGFNELGDGVGEAADGAAQLARGGGQLAEGASQLADGTQQLADGTGELASGATQLADGTGALAGGATQLADGAGGLAGGASQLSEGAASLSEGVAAYVGGASQLSDSYAQLSSGAQGAVTQLQSLVTALTGLQVAVAEPQQQLQQGLTDAGAATEGLGADIATLYAECAASGADPAFCDQMAATLQNRAGEIGTGVGLAGSGASGLGDAMAGLQGVAGDGGTGGDPIAQLDQLNSGLAEFGAGLSGFAEQGAQLAQGASDLASGAAGVSDGAAQLAGGANELASGTTQLSTGASELASGTTQLAEQTPQLAEGATQLAEGTEQSASGAQDLAAGLNSAAQSVPQTSDDERAQLARTAATPVLAEGGSDELFNASGVPLFTGVALWAGALAAFLTLAPLWRRTREAARGVGFITVRSALPAAALGAAQGAIAGAVLPIALGYDFGQGAQFFGFALLAGVAFALVVQGLSALLRGFGKFIAFALLVVAFAVGIVSTVPGALAAVGDFSPLGAASAGFQAIATGATSAGGAAISLVLWALAGLALTLFAVTRARRTR